MAVLKTRHLTALRPHKYGTRHLTAGEDYEAPARHAIALVAGKKAKFAETGSPPPRKPLPPVPVDTEPVVADSAEAETTEAEDDLRTQARQLGIEVDGRWGSMRLRHEIAKARG